MKHFWVVINYNSNPIEIEIPENATIIIGKSSTLQPTEVLVWKTGYIDYQKSEKSL